MTVGLNYAALREPERAVVRRLAVFDGGWTLDAAQHVCDLPAAPLRAVMEQPVVAPEPGGGRFRMPEPVRKEALRELCALPEAQAARDRHLEYFVQLATAAKPELTGPSQATWFSRLDAERRNILAAHEWAGQDTRHATAGLKLVNSIKLYWMNRGLLHLGLAVMLEALHRPGAQAPTAERAQGLFNAGQLRYFMGKHGEARRCLEASLEIARTLGDPYVAAVLQPLGMAAMGDGDFALARRCFDESTQLSQARGDGRGLAGAFNCLGMLHRVQGEWSRARPLYEQVVQFADEQGNDEAKVTGLLNLAMVSTDMGFRDEARAQLQEAAELAACICSVPGAQAALDAAAGLACVEGDSEAAVRFFGAAEAQAMRSGVRRDMADAMFVEPKMARARAMMPAGRFEIARHEGADMPLFAVLAEALAWLGRDASEEITTARAPSPDLSRHPRSQRQERKQ